MRRRPLHLYLPDLSRPHLEARAREHADQLAMDHADYDGPPDLPVDRLVVNMLRHEYTDYDVYQSAERRAAANAAIAQRYPWLADECARQSRHRVAQDRAAIDALAWVAEWQRQAQVARRDAAAAARAVCGSFHVGQPVAVTVKGHARTGTVVKVGRSRLTVRYQIKTGEEREVLVHATKVQPLAADSRSA